MTFEEFKKRAIAQGHFRVPHDIWDISRTPRRCMKPWLVKVEGCVCQVVNQDGEHLTIKALHGKKKCHIVHISNVQLNMT